MFWETMLPLSSWLNCVGLCVGGGRVIRNYPVKGNVCPREQSVTGVMSRHPSKCANKQLKTNSMTFSPQSNYAN
jgi:hypothetical protein